MCDNKLLKNQFIFIALILRKSYAKESLFFFQWKVCEIFYIQSSDTQEISGIENRNIYTVFYKVLLHTFLRFVMCGSKALRIMDLAVKTNVDHTDDYNDEENGRRVSMYNSA